MSGVTHGKKEKKNREPLMPSSGELWKSSKASALTKTFTTREAIIGRPKVGDSGRKKSWTKAVILFPCIPLYPKDWLLKKKKKS
jgi:hypothetical protein